jgi:hypothetical protein
VSRFTRRASRRRLATAVPTSPSHLFQFEPPERIFIHHILALPKHVALARLDARAERAHERAHASRRHARPRVAHHVERPADFRVRRRRAVTVRIDGGVDGIFPCVRPRVVRASTATCRRRRRQTRASRSLKKRFSARMKE